MSVDAELPFAAEVERMLRDGHSFTQVEQFIEAQGISEDQKWALWRHAWVQSDKAVPWDRESRPQRRQGTAPPLP
jgi:rhamnogalacturonyl hydrolase YesR